MTEMSVLELRSLAAKIASAYGRANPTPADNLSTVIQSAYAGLQRCIAPLPSPTAPIETKGRRRRGRPPSK